MKFLHLIFALLTVGLLVGCEWSPTRNNPRDPMANNYRPLEAIQGLRIETHCKWDREDFCYMTIFAKVWDPEGVSALDRAWIYLRDSADVRLWQMNYNPPDSFTLSIWANSDSLPKHIIYYETKYFILRFEDDKGIITEDSTRISRAICSSQNDYPMTSSPADSDDVFTPHPVLVWEPYSAYFDFAYHIQCFQGEQERLVWDTSGVSAQTDSVRVGDSLGVSAGESGFYCWKVIVVDVAGNTAESKCTKFWVH